MVYLMSDESSSNVDNDDEFIVFSLDSDEMNDLGKILGTKYSREFLRITQTEVLNLKEIAKRIEKTENPRLPNPTHHKKRLEKLGLIFGKLKLQRKNGHKLSYYKGKKIIVIVRDKDLAEIARNSSELKNTIKGILKFGAIGVAAITTFMITDFNRLFGSDQISYSSQIPIMIFPVAVVSIGLIISFLYKKIRFNRHRM